MSNYRIDCKDRAEWLAHRAKGIGASEIGTLLGINPFESPYQLWLRKTGQTAPKEENFAMRAGHYLEEAVALFYQDETKRQIIKNTREDFIVAKTGKPFLRVSPDRFFWREGKHNADNKGILECKTTQKSIDAEDLPKHWFAQLQYQLGVCEMEFGSLAWLTQGREFGHKDLAFVPDFYEWIAAEAEKFYIDNIIGGKAPDAKCIADVLCKYPKSQTVTAALEEVFKDEQNASERAMDIAAACADYKRIADEIKQLEEEQAVYEEKIKLCFNDAEALSYGGNVIATWKSSKDSETFDSKLFKAEHPELAAQYMKPKPGSRRFLVK